MFEVKIKKLFNSLSFFKKTEVVCHKTCFCQQPLSFPRVQFDGKKSEKVFVCVMKLQMFLVVWFPLVRKEYLNNFCFLVTIIIHILALTPSLVIFLSFSLNLVGVSVLLWRSGRLYNWGRPCFLRNLDVSFFDRFITLMSIVTFRNVTF